jgi:hypothetical protein
MLEAGWMIRYLRAIERAVASDVAVIVGFVWVGLMFVSAAQNAFIALAWSVTTWAVVMPVRDRSNYRTQRALRGPCVMHFYCNIFSHECVRLFSSHAVGWARQRAGRPQAFPTIKQRLPFFNQATATK